MDHHLCGLTTVLAVVLYAVLGHAAERLEQHFVNPSDSARPHAFWYWMDGNITREGIDADLEAMKRVGIGGVELYNIGGHSAAGPVKVLSPQWRELMRYAIVWCAPWRVEVTGVIEQEPISR